MFTTFFTAHFRANSRWDVGGSGNRGEAGGEELWPGIREDQSPDQLQHVHSQGEDIRIAR